MPTRFFLTHSWKDIDFARRLRNDLVASGVDGFFDAYSIQPGDIISLEISRGLEACDIYVPILSYAALKSPWCEEEIHAAITLGKLPGRNGRPRIVPVLVEDCVEEMPILLRTRLYIEFADRYDEALEELLTKTFGIPGRKAAPTATGDPELKSAVDYFTRGNFYKAKGDFDRALVDYTQALNLDPKFAIAYNNRGNVYYAKGDLDRALADFNQALSLDPKFAIAYFNRGDIYNRKLDLDRALADYNQALSPDPKCAIAYKNRGNVYYVKGDLDRALADYNQALSLDPKDALAYFNRGLIHRKKGRKAQAIADFQAYLQLNPGASDRATIEQSIQKLKR